MEAVRLETDGPCGWLTLDRPKKYNALSFEMMAALRQKLDEVSRQTDIRIVVIRGNGPGFCAGHDIKEMVAAEDIHQYRRIFSECSDLMQAVHKVPQPVIAQVHGVATAAGCQLVAACDLAIAADNARFATPGVKIGLFCTTPMVPLVRVIGRRRAMEMLLSGRFVSAQEAKQFGLVNRVVGADQLADETRTWAAELARSSGFTLSFGKEVFYRQVDLAEADAYAMGREAMAINSMAEDAQEGMQAFLDKRPPEWRHK